MSSRLEGDPRSAVEYSPASVMTAFVLNQILGCMLILGAAAFFYFRNYFPVKGRPLGLYAFMVIIILTYYCYENAVILTPFPGIDCRHMLLIIGQCYNLLAATLIFQAWSLFVRTKIMAELESVGRHLLQTLQQNAGIDVQLTPRNNEAAAANCEVAAKSKTNHATQGLWRWLCCFSLSQFFNKRLDMLKKIANKPTVPSNWYQQHRYIASLRTFLLYISVVFTLEWVFYVVLIRTDVLARTTHECTDSRMVQMNLVLLSIQLLMFSSLAYRIGYLGRDNFGLKREIASIGWTTAILIVCWLLWDFLDSASSSRYMAGDIFTTVCMSVVVWFCFVNPSRMAFYALHALHPSRLNLTDILTNKNAAITRAFLDFVGSEFSTENFLCWQECEAFSRLFDHSYPALLASKNSKGEGNDSSRNVSHHGSRKGSLMGSPRALLASNEGNGSSRNVSRHGSRKGSLASPGALLASNEGNGSSRLGSRIGTPLGSPRASPQENAKSLDPASARQSTGESDVREVIMVGPEPSYGEPADELAYEIITVDQGKMAMVLDQGKMAMALATLPELEENLLRISDLYMTSTSVRQVNISATNSKEVVNMLTEFRQVEDSENYSTRLERLKRGKEVLVKVQKEIFGLMQNDSFVRFQHSMKPEKIQTMSESFIQSVREVGTPASESKMKFSFHSPDRRSDGRSFMEASAVPSREESKLRVNEGDCSPCSPSPGPSTPPAEIDPDNSLHKIQIEPAPNEEPVEIIPPPAR